MPRTSGAWTIDGTHHAEYAAQWGAGNSGEGALFYNAADVDRAGNVIGNPYWDSNEWRTFAGVVRKQCAGGGAGHTLRLWAGAYRVERCGRSQPPEVGGMGGVYGGPRPLYLPVRLPDHVAP